MVVLQHEFFDELLKSKAYEIHFFKYHKKIFFLFYFDYYYFE